MDIHIGFHNNPGRNDFLTSWVNKLDEHKRRACILSWANSDYAWQRAPDLAAANHSGIPERGRAIEFLLTYATKIVFELRLLFESDYVTATRVNLETKTPLLFPEETSPQSHEALDLPDVHLGTWM